MLKELEAMIDKNGLFAVLDALSAVCGDKSSHIENNWQDTGLADDWAKAADAIDAAASKVLDLKLS